MNRGRESDRRLQKPLMQPTPETATAEEEGSLTECLKSKQSDHWAWWWELTSVIGSALCTASIVAILASMHGKPLSNWTFLLSLPATIALFSTAAKLLAGVAAAAGISQSKWLHFRSNPRPLRDFDLFENASRGPMGSLRLLGFGPWGLVSIGAFATVLAVGFDVFAQQLVQLDIKDVMVDDGTAVLGLAHEYITRDHPLGIDEGQLLEG